MAAEAAVRPLPRAEREGAPAVYEAAGARAVGFEALAGLDAVESLAPRVTVGDVLACELTPTSWDVDQAHRCLVELAYGSGGKIEVSGEGREVVYVLPEGIRGRLRRDQWRFRLAEHAATAGRYAFAGFRMLFALALLLSIVVLAAAIVALVIMSKQNGGGGRHGHGGHGIGGGGGGGGRRGGPGLHHVHRAFYRGPIFGNDFFTYLLLRDALAPRYVYRERAPRAAAPVPSAPSCGGGGGAGGGGGGAPPPPPPPRRLARPDGDDDDDDLEAGRGGGGDGDEELSLLGVIFEFCFGDRVPRPDLEARRMRAVASLVRRSGGAVVAEQVAPFTDECLLGTGQAAPGTHEGFMLPYLHRFGGVAVASEAGGLAYRFPTLAGTAQPGGAAGAGYQDPLPPPILEEPRPFSTLSDSQLAKAAGLGVFNVLEVVAFRVAANAYRNELRGFTAAVDSVFWYLAVYAALYLAIPAARYAWLRVRNARAGRRNETRRARVAELVRELMSDENDAKVRFAESQRV